MLGLAVPGARVGSVINNGGLTTFTGLSIDLAPSTQYWMVLTQTGAFQGSWGFNSETTGTGAGFLLDNTFRTTTPTWQSASQIQPYRMEVTAVPEPASIQFLVSGASLAVLGRMVRRRAARA